MILRLSVLPCLLINYFNGDIIIVEIVHRSAFDIMISMALFDRVQRDSSMGTA
jgi:hypothetical protein